MIRSPILAIATLLAAIMLGGCSVNPTYEVRVINDSSTNLNARIEHRPKFDTPIVLESVVIKAGQERTLGPVESPPMERVVLLIGPVNDSMSSPESFVIKRGSYVARIGRGSSTSWSPYEVSLLKE